MQQLPAAATATQAQLLSPTGQLQAVHQPPPAAVQTQQALQQDPNDPNKWHVVQVATAAAAQPAQAAPIATAQLVTAAPAVSMASVVAAAAADDSIAAASSTTDVKSSHGTGRQFKGWHLA